MIRKPTYEELEQRVKALEKVGVEHKQAEEALRVSEAKYRRVSDNSPAVLYQFMMMPNGVISFPYISDVIESIMGITPEEVMKDSSKLFGMVHPDDQRMLQEGIAKSAASLESFPLTFRCLKDGKVIWIEARGMPTALADGSILWDGFLLDVTENMQLQEALRKSEGRLKQAQAIAHLGNWELDFRKKQITLSDEASRIFGLPVRNVPLNHETFLKQVHPKDRAYHKKMSGRLISNGKAEFEYRILSPEGAVRWVWHQGEAYYDKARIPFNAVGTIQDITERKRAEGRLVQARNELELRVKERTAELSKANQLLLREIEERELTDEKLRQAERKYRTIADYTYDWEYWVHVDGKFSWVSRSCERISGYTAQEFTDTPSLFREIIVPEDRGIWDQHYADSRTKLDGGELQFRIQRRDGKIRWIEHVCQPVFDDQGNFQGIRASNRDITQRQFYKTETHQLQSELAHMDRVFSINTLASALAHEINQPLAAMRSYAQAALRFIDRDPPEYDSVRKALKGIVADNKRAAGIINRLRGLAKKGAMRRKPIVINSIINEVMNLVSSEIILRNASITLDLQSSIPVVQGDTIQIQQVLINLLTNAFDATDDQPIHARNITISTRFENSNGIIISISDSGKGIPLDTFEDLFSPFHTTKSEGMGLGLSICKSIVKAHDGKLWAENNPDGGAIFHITLPTDSRAGQRMTGAEI